MSEKAGGTENLTMSIVCLQKQEPWAQEFQSKHWWMIGIISMLTARDPNSQPQNRGALVPGVQKIFQHCVVILASLTISPSWFHMVSNSLYSKSLSAKGCCHSTPVPKGNLVSKWENTVRTLWERHKINSKHSSRRRHSTPFPENKIQKSFELKCNFL